MQYWFHHNYPKASAKLTKAGLILLFISLLIGYLINSVFSKLADAEIAKLQGHITSWDFDSNSEKNPICLSMKLQEYPQTNFVFQDKYCRGLDKEGFKNTVSIGDIVMVEASKESMNSKPSNINILYLNSKGTVFLSQDKIEEAYKENFFLMKTLSIIGIGILLLYAVLDLTGIIDKLRNWLSKTQSSIVNYHERPTSRDFNELGD